MSSAAAPAATTCDICHLMPSSVHCAACALTACTECDRELHSAAATRGHQRDGVSASAASVCGVCRSSPTAWHCTSCALDLCDERGCDAELHRGSQLGFHERQGRGPNSGQTRPPRTAVAAPFAAVAAPPSPALPRALVHPCQLCNQAEAIVRCATCSLDLCLENHCDSELHSATALKAHARTAIGSNNTVAAAPPAFVAPSLSIAIDEPAVSTPISTPKLSTPTALPPILAAAAARAAAVPALPSPRTLGANATPEQMKAEAKRKAAESVAAMRKQRADDAAALQKRMDEAAAATASAIADITSSALSDEAINAAASLEPVALPLPTAAPSSELPLTPEPAPNDSATVLSSVPSSAPGLGQADAATRIQALARGHQTRAKLKAAPPVVAITPPVEVPLDAAPATNDAIVTAAAIPPVESSPPTPEEQVAPSATPEAPAVMCEVCEDYPAEVHCELCGMDVCVNGGGCDRQLHAPAKNAKHVRTPIGALPAAAVVAPPTLVAAAVPSTPAEIAPSTPVAAATPATPSTSTAPTAVESAPVVEADPCDICEDAPAEVHCASCGMGLCLANGCDAEIHAPAKNAKHVRIPIGATAITAATEPSASAEPSPAPTPAPIAPEVSPTPIAVATSEAIASPSPLPSPSSSATEQSAPVIASATPAVMCEVCEDYPAEVHCESCGMDVCISGGGCDRQLHAPAKNAMHVRTPLGGVVAAVEPIAAEISPRVAAAEPTTAPTPAEEVTTVDTIVDAAIPEPIPAVPAPVEPTVVPPATEIKVDSTTWYTEMPPPNGTSLSEASLAATPSVLEPALSQADAAIKLQALARGNAARKKIALAPSVRILSSRGAAIPLSDDATTLCDHCGECLATLLCSECDQRLCQTDCDRERHMLVAMSSHKRVPWPVTVVPAVEVEVETTPVEHETLCDQCHEAAATVWCESCTKAYCGTQGCDTIVHAQMGFVAHLRVSLAHYRSLETTPTAAATLTDHQALAPVRARSDDTLPLANPSTKRGSSFTFDQPANLASALMAAEGELLATEMAIVEESPLPSPISSPLSPPLPPSCDLCEEFPANVYCEACAMHYCSVEGSNACDRNVHKQAHNVAHVRVDLDAEVEALPVPTVVTMQPHESSQQTEVAISPISDHHVRFADASPDHADDPASSPRMQIYVSSSETGAQQIVLQRRFSRRAASISSLQSEVVMEEDEADDHSAPQSPDVPFVAMCCEMCGTEEATVHCKECAMHLCWSTTIDAEGVVREGGCSVFRHSQAKKQGHRLRKLRKPTPVLANMFDRTPSGEWAKGTVEKVAMLPYIDPAALASPSAAEPVQLCSVCDEFAAAYHCVECAMDLCDASANGCERALHRRPENVAHHRTRLVGSTPGRSAHASGRTSGAATPKHTALQREREIELQRANAATRIQSLQRGRVGRKAAADHKAKVVQDHIALDLASRRGAPLSPIPGSPSMVESTRYDFRAAMGSKRQTFMAQEAAEANAQVQVALARGRSRERTELTVHLQGTEDEAVPSPTPRARSSDAASRAAAARAVEDLRAREEARETVRRTESVARAVQVETDRRSRERAEREEVAAKEAQREKEEEEQRLRQNARLSAEDAAASALHQARREQATREAAVQQSSVTLSFLNNEPALDNGHPEFQLGLASLGLGLTTPPPHSSANLTPNTLPSHHRFNSPPMPLDSPLVSRPLSAPVRILSPTSRSNHTHVVPSAYSQVVHHSSPPAPFVQPVFSFDVEASQSEASQAQVRAQVAAVVEEDDDDLSMFTAQQRPQANNFLHAPFNTHDPPSPWAPVSTSPSPPGTSGSPSPTRTRGGVATEQEHLLTQQLYALSAETAALQLSQRLEAERAARLEEQLTFERAEARRAAEQHAGGYGAVPPGSPSSIDRAHASQLERDLAGMRAQMASMQSAMLSQSTVHSTFLQGLDCQMRLLEMNRSMLAQEKADLERERIAAREKAQIEAAREAAKDKRAVRDARLGRAGRVAANVNVELDREAPQQQQPRPPSAARSGSRARPASAVRAHKKEEEKSSSSRPDFNLRPTVSDVVWTQTQDRQQRLDYSESLARSKASHKHSLVAHDGSRELPPKHSETVADPLRNGTFVKSEPANILKHIFAASGQGVSGSNGSIAPPGLVEKMRQHTVFPSANSVPLRVFAELDAQLKQGKHKQAPSDDAESVGGWTRVEPVISPHLYAPAPLSPFRIAKQMAWAAQQEKHGRSASLADYAHQLEGVVAWDPAFETPREDEEEQGGPWQDDVSQQPEEEDDASIRPSRPTSAPSGRRGKRAKVSVSQHRLRNDPISRLAAGQSSVAHSLAFTPYLRHLAFDIAAGKLSSPGNPVVPRREHKALLARLANPDNLPVRPPRPPHIDPQAPYSFEQNRPSFLATVSSMTHTAALGRTGRRPASAAPRSATRAVQTSSSDLSEDWQLPQVPRAYDQRSHHSTGESAASSQSRIELRPTPPTQQRPQSAAIHAHSHSRTTLSSSHSQLSVADLETESVAAGPSQQELADAKRARDLEARRLTEEKKQAAAAAAAAAKAAKIQAEADKQAAIEAEKQAKVEAAARVKAEKAAALAAEKAVKVAADLAAKETRDREAREAKEKAEQLAAEAKAKAERDAAEAKEKAERDAAEALARKEREEREAREKAEADAKAAAEKAEREEREAKEKAEADAKAAAEKAERDAAETKAKAEREEAEAKAKAEREAEYARARAEAEAREAERARLQAEEDAKPKHPLPVPKYCQMCEDETPEVWCGECKLFMCVCRGDGCSPDMHKLVGKMSHKTVPITIPAATPTVVATPTPVTVTAAAPVAAAPSPVASPAAAAPPPLSTKPAALVECEMCEAAPATLKCVNCDFDLCRTCDDELHRPAAKKNHVRKPLGLQVPLASPADSVSSLESVRPDCGLCDDNDAVVFCRECNMNLCIEGGCDADLHIGRKAAHVRTKL